MGKKRIAELLDQLHTNHEADLNNAAAVFTVAQVAVNQLAQQTVEDNAAPVLGLALSPVLISKEQLKQQYGSFNACRKAAKQAGIRFSSTPTWDQLAATFNYFEALQSLIQNYLITYPNSHLGGVSMEFKLEP